MAEERGSVSTEFAIVMTAFLTGFVLLIVFAGRVAQADNDVQGAAQEAARAASLVDDPGRAVERATQVAQANLVSSGLSCANGSSVDVGLDNFRPGGWVRVTVTCRASFADVASLAVPGERTFSSTATEVIDTYRSDP